MPCAASAARVYAVDASAGQLRGWLRADSRVINLERTNLARPGPHLITEPADLITMDLSYLAIADTTGQAGPQLLAPAAPLIALVKPTFELHAATLAGQPQQVAAAVETGVSADIPVRKPRGQAARALAALSNTEMAPVRESGLAGR